MMMLRRVPLMLGAGLMAARHMGHRRWLERAMGIELTTHGLGTRVMVLA